MNFLRFLQFSLLIVLMIPSAPLRSQTKTVRTTTQQWIQYYNQINLSERWTLLTEGSYRWSEVFGNRTNFIIRTGFAYSLPDNLSVAAGVTLAGSYTLGRISRLEFRPQQECAFRVKYGSVGLLQRLRIEERFFNDLAEGKLTGDRSFNFRLRYRVFATVPLLSVSQVHPERVLSLGIGDELFLNAGEQVITNVFDQNRILVGPSYQAERNVSVALIYNADFAGTSTPGSYAFIHVFWLTVTHKIDFTHKEPNP